MAISATPEELDEILNDFQDDQESDITRYTPDQLTQFTRWRVSEYIRYGYTGEDLYEWFTSDFKYFNEDTFRSLKSGDTTPVRALLVSKGVSHPTRKGGGSNASYLNDIKNLLWIDLYQGTGSDTPRITEETNLNQTSTGPGFRPGNTATLNREGTPVDFYETAPFGRIGSETEFPRRDRRLATPLEISKSSSISKVYGYSKQLATLAKMYSKEDRYGGTSEESWEMHWIVFCDRCGMAELPRLARQFGFAIALKDDALQFFYTNLKGLDLDADALYLRIKQYYEGPEVARQRQADWNRISLRTKLQKYPNK